MVTTHASLLASRHQAEDDGHVSARNLTDPFCTQQSMQGVFLSFCAKVVGLQISNQEPPFRQNVSFMTTFHEISSKYIVKAFHILTMNICHYSLFCFVFGKLVLLNYYNRYRLSRERKKSNLQRLISSDFHILFYLKSSER